MVALYCLVSFTHSMPEIILSYWSPFGILLSFEAFSSSWAFFSVAAMIRCDYVLRFEDTVCRKV